MLFKKKLYSHYSKRRSVQKKINPKDGKNIQAQGLEKIKKNKSKRREKIYRLKVWKRNHQYDHYIKVPSTTHREGTIILMRPLAETLSINSQH